jgi:hypothetical protein
VADSFVGPMRSSAPLGSPTQYTDPKQIDAILKSSDPEAVAESGRSYQKFAAAYEKIAGELLGMRSDLHDAWSGEPAAAAAQSLRRDHRTPRVRAPGLVQVQQAPVQGPV